MEALCILYVNCAQRVTRMPAREHFYILLLLWCYILVEIEICMHKFSQIPQSCLFVCTQKLAELDYAEWMCVCVCVQWDLNLPSESLRSEERQVRSTENFSTFTVRTLAWIVIPICGSGSNRVKEGKRKHNMPQPQNYVLYIQFQ